MATTTSRVSRLAALAQPIRPCEDDKAAVLKDFERAAAKLHAIAVTAPDDKDELVEKEVWCRQWNGVMCTFWTLPPLRKLQRPNNCTRSGLKRSCDVMRMPRDRRRRPGALAHARGYPNPRAFYLNQGQTAEINGGGDNVRAKGPVKTWRKRTRKRRPPCPRHGRARPPVCQVRGEGSPCRGIPGRACEKCHVHKIACEKWSGRSWAADKKGKAPARPVRVPKAGPSRRQPSPVSMDDDSAIEEPKEKGKTKTPVASSKTEISKAQLELYMQNIVKCEAKIRTSQGRLKKAEAELNEAMSDLGDLKSTAEWFRNQCRP
ncbi:hypothetical protein BU15DRAFT_62754 [Melanogaster broomeanus]|nr:hypothetical protein BU15DRAFT_62754 [Melanogaster broomeanus]